MNSYLKFIKKAVAVGFIGSLSAAAFAATTYNNPSVPAYIPGFQGGFSGGGGIVVAPTAGVLDQFCIYKGHTHSTGASGMKFLTPQPPYGPYNVGSGSFFIHSYSGGEFVGTHMSQTGGNPVPVFTQITCEG